MFEIGSSLRQARQHRGLALADVERKTRVRAKYLGALEDERFDVLPGQAYVRGFLRSYAEFLGLDGNLYVAEYNEKHAEPEDDLPPIAHEPLGHGRRLRVARPLAGALVAAVATVVVVWQLGFTTPEARPLTTTQVTIQPAATSKPAAKPKPKQAAAPAKPGVLVVHAARGDCWVAVRFGSATGKKVVVRTLARGGTLRFGLDRKLWVRLGAPWNVDVTVRGKRVAPASASRPVNLVAS